MILIIFYGITFFGTALSAVASLLNVVPVFGSNTYLGVALGFKTLFLSFVAPYVFMLMRKVGTKGAIAMSQVCGALFLGIIALGFYMESFSLYLVGVLLSGIPSTVISVAAPVVLKRSAKNDDHFRSLQGYMRVVGSTCILIAMAVSPLVLISFGINGVLAFDFATYLMALPLVIYFPKTDLEAGHSLSTTLLEKRRDLRISEQLTKPPVQAFLLGGFALFILRGLAPILAGGTSNFLTEILTPAIKNQMWTIESAAEMLGGLVYAKIGASRIKRLPVAVFYLSSLLIVPGLLLTHTGLLTLSLFLMFCICEIGFSLKRDDLFLSTNNDLELAKYSAFSVLYTNLLMAISPFVMNFALSGSSLMFLGICIGMQAVAFLLSFKRGGARL